MGTFSQRLVASILACSFSASAFAQRQGGDQTSPSQRAQNLQFGLSRGAEFSAGTYPGEVLLPIYLIGAVPRPGIYNVPKKTELLRLLTLAGGLSPNANTDDEITVKRRLNTEEKVFRVDLDALLRTAGKESIFLESGDIVYIPPKEPLISPETSSLLGFVATILSITTTALVLNSTLERRN